MYICLGADVSRWHDTKAKMESSKDTSRQAPEGPILCISNCGFFGSATTMNMCSKCHKEMILKQEQAKFAASSFESIVNGCVSSSSEKEVVVAVSGGKLTGLVVEEFKVVLPVQAAPDLSVEAKRKEGPNRCTSCRKRVGLIAFHCRCGNIFCGVHHTLTSMTARLITGLLPIAKANPVRLPIYLGIS